MTRNQELAQVLIQQAFFDIQDLLNGETYQALGYATRREFLQDQAERLAEAERRLFTTTDTRG
jgi:hypothetical protein